MHIEHTLLGIIHFNNVIMKRPIRSRLFSRLHCLRLLQSMAFGPVFLSMFLRNHNVRNTNKHWHILVMRMPLVPLLRAVLSLTCR